MVDKILSVFKIARIAKDSDSLTNDEMARSKQFFSTRCDVLIQCLLLLITGNEKGIQRPKIS